MVLMRQLESIDVMIAFDINLKQLFSTQSRHIRVTSAMQELWVNMYDTGTDTMGRA